MSDIAIRVENLSKRYTIGESESYKTLRDIIAGTLEAPFRTALSVFKGNKSKAGRLSESSHIWALKDVSFEIKRGEVVGIIGQNGAGKSTLLKILSRITEPTEGFVEINGRIASLLEVGTGFHSELTGRENIYLNGAILGMKRAEINKKFDEIVEFAGVPKFLDTPVKHYSSGMYMRLAFAVAAHLEPEILLVDEVLAVGDAQFQRKCLGKMKEVGKQGRTVIFVSHNMDAITNLCSRALILENGNLTNTGSAAKMVEVYLGEIENSTIKGITKSGDEDVRIVNSRVINSSRRPVKKVSIKEPFGLEIEYEIFKNLISLLPNFAILTMNDMVVLHNICINPPTGKGKHRVICWFPPHLLNNKKFRIKIAIVSFSPFTVDHAIQEIIFEVMDDIDESYRGNYRGEIHGVVRPNLNWENIS